MIFFIETCKDILKIQKFRRVVSYTGFYCFATILNYAYASNTTRAGYSRADQFYASYPAGTELLTNTAKLYKASLGNCFEIEDWGPIEYCIMAKHFERQGKSPYAYHAQYMAHLLSLGELDAQKGSLRVFKWPSMDVVIDEAQAHASVKDLDYSPDGKFLVSSGSGGPCRVWDVASSAVLASLPKENDETFGFCRFSQSNDSNLFLYTTVTRDRGSSIVIWNTVTWKRIRSKQIVRDAISVFSVSPDGKFVAVGTVQGDLLIINSTSMRVQTIVKKAYLGFVTALTFSQDSKALASVSMDSSARVTIITEKTTNGSGYGLWVVMLMIILAIAAYALKVKGLLVLIKE